MFSSLENADVQKSLNAQECLSSDPKKVLRAITVQFIRNPPRFR